MNQEAQPDSQALEIVLKSCTLCSLSSRAQSCPQAGVGALLARLPFIPPAATKPKATGSGLGSHAVACVACGQNLSSFHYRRKFPACLLSAHSVSSARPAFMTLLQRAWERFYICSAFKILLVAVLAFVFSPSVQCRHIPERLSPKTCGGLNWLRHGGYGEALVQYAALGVCHSYELPKSKWSDESG